MRMLNAEYRVMLMIQHFLSLQLFMATTLISSGTFRTQLSGNDM